MFQEARRGLPSYHSPKQGEKEGPESSGSFLLVDEVSIACDSFFVVT